MSYGFIHHITKLFKTLFSLVQKTKSVEHPNRNLSNLRLLEFKKRQNT